MSEPPPLLGGTIILTALLLAVLVCAQTLSAYMTAYLSAPTEILPFRDTCDFSIQENESYDLDITKIPRLEDRVRLHRLYREIQRNGDDLREELNRLLLDGDEGGTTLRMSARLLWKVRRKGLEERVKRGDMLRMRFLVVYLGLIASASHASSNTSSMAKDPEKWSLPMAREIPKAPPPPPGMPGPTRPVLPHALTDGIIKNRGPPLRRLTTQAMGHNSGNVGKGQAGNWGSLMDELQKSPIMARRRESIEVAMMLEKVKEESG